jgi:PQQ-dependent catabolism-associated CXXCW motif protein
VYIAALALSLSAGAAEQSELEEHQDWGVAPTAQLRQPPYSAPTPRSAPGVATIATQALKRMLETELEPAPVLIDVASGDGHRTLPGAFWLPGAGRGTHFIDGLQASFAALLEKLTNGDKQRPVVFFCVNIQCWLSYNASLRAVAAGYQRVYWYRGGIEAWRLARLPLLPMGPAKGQ